MLHPYKRFVFASTLLLALPGLIMAQDEEKERVLRVCERVGTSDLEVGIEGIVRDEESGFPLPHASVTIRYQSERGLPTPKAVTVEADEEGQYQACGLAAFHDVRVRATYSSVRGKEREVPLDRSKFVDLEVDLGKSAFLVFSIVAAANGEPVEGAQIALSPISISGVTDSLGRIAFRAIPPGAYGLTVDHIAFEPREEEISVLTEETAEYRVELITGAIAVAPLEVRITGRDPYLLTSGFYERRATIEDGYFGTYPEIERYQMFRTLFQFKRELTIRFRRNRVVLLNGRPAMRLGYDNISSLNEIDFERVRGIEAYPCDEAPADIARYLPLEISLVDCNLISIWTW